MTLLVGGGGQLGTALAALLGDRAVSWTRRDLDLRHLDAIEPAVTALRPGTIINCAAYNQVDRAESEPDEARTVNALAVERLAAAAAAVGARFVTYSSDFVFDGTASTPYVESSAPHPLSAYGRSKLEGERLAAEAFPGALIIRTSWLISPTGRNYATLVLDVARGGGGRFVDDQVGRMTLADDLAAATMAALDAGAEGLLHLANQGEVSRYRLACEILEMAGLDPTLIRPCSSAELGAPARRPAYAPLGSERLSSLGLDPLPHYRRGLAEVVAALA